MMLDMILGIHSPTRRAAHLLVAGMLLAAVGCTPEGVINKTKYDGKKITNTCDQFQAEVKALMEANAGVATLRVAEYDNSQFDTYFLEPGQFEQRGDTLYFRLINDIEYDKYLQKGVAFHVKGKYKAQDHLKAMEKDPEGEIGMLVLDRAYYDRNKEPSFVYKMPAADKLNGKILSLEFSVVQYDKKGKFKKAFCNSIETPIGPLDPSCCTDKPYQNVKAQSVVQVPKLDIKDENYRYKNFTGTLDLIFPMSVAEPFDSSKKRLADVILNYIDKYEKQGFTLKGIQFDGYASQGGKVEYNQDLSKRRCEAVYNEMVTQFKAQNRLEGLKIDYAGKGEDWDRFKLLVNTAGFSTEQRKEILSIAGSGKDDDAKEEDLRKLPYWQKLVDDVLVYCRHTYINFSFDFTQDRMYVESYREKMPVISPELYNVATKQFTISQFKKGEDPNAGLGTLNVLIDDNGNKKPNLFAMRSTYHFALNDVKAAVGDIENALSADKENKQYALAALSYKTKFASSYSLDERMRMLNEYTDFLLKNPNDQALAYNRAVMMDNVGFISGALAEYDNIMKPGSKDAILLNNRGVARMKTNRMTEAEADFKDAITANPEQAEAYFNLAIVYAWKGLPAKVMANLDQAITINSSMKCMVFDNPAFKSLRSNKKFAKYRCE